MIISVYERSLADRPYSDREKCLEAGMNNYLAKPVRADTLKQMLESYLRQPARPIPNLQLEAKRLVDTVISSPLEEPQKPGKLVKRPSIDPHQGHDHTSEKDDTQIRLAPEDMAKDTKSNQSSNANGAIDMPTRQSDGAADRTQPR